MANPIDSFNLPLSNQTRRPAPSEPVHAGPPLKQGVYYKKDGSGFQEVGEVAQVESNIAWQDLTESERVILLDMGHQEGEAVNVSHWRTLANDLDNMRPPVPEGQAPTPLPKPVDISELPEAEQKKYRERYADILGYSQPAQAAAAPTSADVTGMQQLMDQSISEMMQQEDAKIFQAINQAIQRPEQIAREEFARSQAAPDPVPERSDRDAMGSLNPTVQQAIAQPVSVDAAKPEPQPEPQEEQAPLKPVIELTDEDRLLFLQHVYGGPYRRVKHIKPKGAYRDERQGSIVMTFHRPDVSAYNMIDRQIALDSMSGELLNHLILATRFDHYSLLVHLEELVVGQNHFRFPPIDQWGLDVPDGQTPLKPALEAFISKWANPSLMNLMVRSCNEFVARIMTLEAEFTQENF